MKLAPTPENPSDITAIARLCKSLGDPLRLEILRVMRTESFAVLELCDIFEVKQPALSHHLKVMASAGVVTSRREGNSIFYRRPLLSESSQGQLLRSLFNALDQIPLTSNMAAKVNEIKASRGGIAKEFFNRQGDNFRSQQDLIAPFEQYAANTTDLLLNGESGKALSVLEIGPGEGNYLTQLSHGFQQVWAVDIAQEMLEQAEVVVTQHQLTNVVLLLGDTETALQKDIRADRIVCNMVLHHVPSPADIFRDCSLLLADGGTLVITDLCRHDQLWVKENCGDLWLGFEPEELSEWAAAAGLINSDSIYLGLRNGFQIQIRRFEKSASQAPQLEY